MIKYLLITTSLFLLLIFFNSCDRFNTPETSVSKKKTGVEYILNESGDSVKITYRKDGSLKSKIGIKNSYLEGLSIIYYDNGKIQYEINYNKSVKHGLTKWFYESGKIYRVTTYVNGQMNGVRKLYHENGKVKAEIPYDYDQLLPGTKEYSSSGKLLKDYPKIKIVPIDRMAVENTYYLQLSLDPKKSDVKYHVYIKREDIEGKIDLERWTKNGVAKYPITVIPGESKMEKIEFRAQFETRKGNPMMIKRTYNLAIENRSAYR